VPCPGSSLARSWSVCTPIEHQRVHVNMEVHRTAEPLHHGNATAAGGAQILIASPRAHVSRRHTTTNPGSTSRGFMVRGTDVA